MSPHITQPLYPPFVFAQLKPLFDEYWTRLQRSGNASQPGHSDLAAEVRERLEQLSFISQQLDQMNALFGVTAIEQRLGPNGEVEYYNNTAERDEKLRFMMRLLTESFYYFAFRIRQILRNDVHRFLELQSFDASGVRDVRNHLIEHPEGKSSRVFNQTFSWSPNCGMQLKSGRHEWEISGFVDTGFVANASQFSANLESALKSAIPRLPDSDCKQESVHDA
jgi:hypothetical protein